MRLHGQEGEGVAYARLHLHEDASHVLEEANSGTTHDRSPRGQTLTANDRGVSFDDTVATTFAFEVDIYNTMIVNFMLRGGSLTHQAVMVIWPLLLALVSAYFQVELSRAVLMHVQATMVPTIAGEVHLKLFDFAIYNKTMSEESSEQICGEFQNVIMGISEPGGQITLPTGELMVGAQFLAKKPSWRWDQNWLGQEKSIFDSLRFVTSEGFQHFHQYFGILFMTVIFMWFCAILEEFRRVFYMCLMLLGVQQPDGKLPPITGHGNVFRINSMPLAAKIVGLIVVVCRGLIASLVGYAGLMFLKYTNEMVDLLLNSLALVFILELDSITFAAFLSTNQRNILENMETVDYNSVLPGKIRRAMKYGWPLYALVSLLGGVAFFRWAQLVRYQDLFDNTAALCLFGGPSTSPDVLTPVPGFCESLLKLTCTLNKTQTHPCVVGDWDVPWAMNIRVPTTDTAWPEDIFDHPDKDAPEANIFLAQESSNPNVARKFRLVDDKGAFRPAAKVPAFMKMTMLAQKACWAMYHPEQTMRHVGRQFGVDVAPFNCRKDTGMGEYFKAFDYLYYTSWLTGLSIDITPHVLKLHDEDEELGRRLGRCRRR